MHQIYTKWGHGVASFTKRGTKWRVTVSHKGRRFSATFSTKTEAREWATRKEVALKSYASGQLGRFKTVADAFHRYAREVSPSKKGHRWETIRLEKLCRSELATIRLDDLLPADVAAWRDDRLKEVSTASVRRELGLMASVFTQCCREWNWMRENPVSHIKRPPNNRPRDRRISEAEIEKLMDEFGYTVGSMISKKKHLVGAFFLLGIETGMRLGEMCRLRREHVFLDEYHVRLVDTKNGTSRNVPLSRTADSILKDVTASLVRVTSEVASATFQKACRKTGIKDLHFHDTRHEATTRLAKKLDVMDLARMIGHRDLKSLMIYYNATPAEIAVALG